MACAWLWLVGCATKPTATSQSNAPTRLHMYFRDQSGAEALYVVERDGTLAFGGGMDARLDRTSWTGPLSAHEASQLESLVRQWALRKPRSTGQPPQTLYRLEWSVDGRNHSARLKGEHPGVQPVRALLEEWSLRRLEGDLQRLPRPGRQK